MGVNNRQYDKSDQNDKSRLGRAPEEEMVCNFTTKGIGTGPQATEAKARRFKVTLKSGGVLLHSRPGGLTRQEAIELSKDWGEVAECVPCSPAEIREAQKSVGDTLIEACQGTGLDPGAFRALLNDEDLADIAAGLIPSRTLQAYAESFAKRLSPPPAGALVRCGDCQHFQRIDHPHMGRCAQGHGRHWLWNTDTRQCEDWLAN